MIGNTVPALDEYLELKVALQDIESMSLSCRVSRVDTPQQIIIDVGDIEEATLKQIAAGLAQQGAGPSFHGLQLCVAVRHVVRNTLRAQYDKLAIAVKQQTAELLDTHYTSQSKEAPHGTTD